MAQRVLERGSVDLGGAGHPARRSVEDPTSSEGSAKVAPELHPTKVDDRSPKRSKSLEVLRKCRSSVVVAQSLGKG
jgi:hypothetical protein